MADNAQTARDLASAGIPVFPCEWQWKKAKAPMTANGFHDATTDAATVGEWWTRWPDALVGIAIPENVVIIDTDEKHDTETGEVYTGDQTLAALGLLGAADTSSLIVRTAGGGLHRWFSVDNPDEFSNTSNVNGRVAVDLRVTGKGYVIAAGSSYELGSYKAIKGDQIGGYRDLAPMPAALVAALKKPKQTASGIAGAMIAAGENPGPNWWLDFNTAPLSSRGRALFERRLDGLLNKLIKNVAGAVAGTRHGALLSNARTIGGYSHYRGWTRAQAENALFAASEANGHVAKDGALSSRLTITAGLDHGELYPLALEQRNEGFKFG